MLLLQWWLVAGLGGLWWLVAGRARGGEQAALGRCVVVAFGALAIYLLCLWLLPWLLLVTTGVESGGLMARLQEDVGCGSRRVLWSNVLHLISLKPWWGWGWEELDYAHFMTLYPGERFCDILDNAHNLPLHLAVELGVPVAAGLLALCLWGVWKGRPWAEHDRTRLWAWAMLSLIGVHSLLEYPLCRIYFLSLFLV